MADDQGTVLSTSTTEQDEDDDKSSAMSVSSTETGTVNTLLKKLNHFIDNLLNT